MQLLGAHVTPSVLLFTVISPMLLLSTFASAESGFLFISSPAKKSVQYARLLTATELARGDRMVLGSLVVGEQVVAPMGLAVDAFRKLLYVADPGLGAVLAIDIIEDSWGEGVLVYNGAKTVVSSVQAQWVATDALGNLFFTDAETNKIFYLPVSAAVSDDDDGSWSPDTSAAPVELYAADAQAPISNPQGIAVFGGQIVWANGEGGGSSSPAIVSTYKVPSTLAAPNFTDVAVGSAAYGVCPSSARIFYTDAETKVKSMKEPGGDVSVVTEGLSQPRGCAYDGDGTIFVADADDGKVYAFAGGGQEGGPRPTWPVVQMPGAFGLAVLASSTAQAGPLLVASVLVTMLTALLHAPGDHVLS